MAVSIPYLMRTGKTKVNSGVTDSGMVNLSHGGFTDQFRVKVNPQRFGGRLHGFEFSDGVSENNSQYSMPHIWLLEMLVLDASIGNNGQKSDASFERNGYHIELSSSPSYIRFETRDDVMDATLTALNAAGSDCSYVQGEDGDIKFIPPSSVAAGYSWHCFVFGPAPFVLGAGYIAAKNFESIVKDCDRTVQGSAPPWTQPWKVQGRRGGVVTPFGATASQFTAGPKVLSIANNSDTNLANMTYLENLGLDSFVYVAAMPSPIKNRSECSYYYQENTADQSVANVRHLNDSMPVPRDSAGNKRFYYTPFGDVEVEAGDTILFKKDYIGCDVVATGVSASEVPYFTCESTNDGGTQTQDTFNCWQPALWWCSGWNDAILNDDEYVNDVNAILYSEDIADVPDDDSTAGSIVRAMFPNSSFVDKFQLTESGRVKSRFVESIFKELMGDPGTDIGVPRAIRQTTFWNCFNREAGSRVLIDFDGLGELARAAGMDVASYEIELAEDKGTEQEFNILAMLHNVLITLGIKMVWKYSETKRSWFIAFKPMFGESIATGVISGRVINIDDLARPVIKATKPGSWMYSKLVANYKTKNGTPAKFGVKLRDARTQAAIQSKTMTISDSITRLPDDPNEIIELMTARLQSYLEEYSTEYFNQKMELKLTRTANIEVGGTMAIEWNSALDIETGKRTADTQYASILSATYGFGASSPGISIEALTSSFKKFGISPAMTCDSIVNTSGTLALAGCSGIAIPIPPGYTSGLGVVGWFGCWSFDEGTGQVVERSCACSNYSVVIWERGVQQLTKEGASRNVWEGTLTQPNSAQVGNDSCSIVLDDDTNFDTRNVANGDFVIKFGRLDDTATQPCQTKLYGWLGGSDGRVEDASAIMQPAIALGP